MFKMNPALKVDVILDLLLTRYLYSEIDTQFTVQDIIGDPRHRELLADPPNSTNPEGERTINGGASGVLKRAFRCGPFNPFEFQEIPWQQLPRSKKGVPNLSPCIQTTIIESRV
jgi:hypothetical protein